MGGRPDQGEDPDLHALQDLLGPRSLRRRRRGERRAEGHAASSGGEGHGAAGGAQGRDTPSGTQGDATLGDAEGDDTARVAPAGEDTGGGLQGPGAALGSSVQRAPASAGAVAPDPAPASTGTGKGPDSPAASTRSDPAGVADTPRADAEAPVAPRAAHDPAAQVRHVPATRGHGHVIEAQTLAPGFAALSPFDPAMGLAERLRKDRLLTVPVRPWPRVAAAAGATLFLALWVLAVRSAALGRPWPSAGLPASGWMLLLAALCAGAFFAMARLWPARELRLPLAPSQEEQLTLIEAQARTMRRLVMAGVGALAGGLAILAAAFAWLSPSSWTGLLVPGSILVAGGVVCGAVGLAKWLPIRMLYVQTLMLRRLEDLGLGRHLAMDPRTADVLVSLDALLGQLPESAVRQFLSKPEAEWYLELIQEVKGGRGGR